jgi:hypothetical protein
MTRTLILCAVAGVVTVAAAQAPNRPDPRTVRLRGDPFPVPHPSGESRPISSNLACMEAFRQHFVEPAGQFRSELVRGNHVL